MTIFRGDPAEIAALKIGDTLFNFDGNRRTYQHSNGSGYSSFGSIYEKHFEPVQIIGETKISWVMKLYDAKVNKKTLESSMKYADRGYFTKGAMEAGIWFHEHRHKIANEVGRVGIEQLKEIARIIGYQP